MTNTKVQVLQAELAPMTLSLWLMPPKNMKAKIQKQIDRLEEGRGTTFEPHVTVIGGIPCQSEFHAQEMTKVLQDGLKGFGKVPCGFSTLAYTSKGVWSQALFLTMEQSAPLMNLCQQSRALLDMDTENWTFAPPVMMPHMSLFYGVSNIPDRSEVEPVPPFHAYSLKLMRTDSTLKSVSSWKEVAVIDLH